MFIQIGPLFEICSMVLLIKVLNCDHSNSHNSSDHNLVKITVKYYFGCSYIETPKTTML